MRNAVTYITLTVLLFVAFVADIVIGNTDISFAEIKTVFSGNAASGDPLSNIILLYRLPKAITAMLCGAALAVSGLLMQTMFRNPLAGPYVLGVSSGAGLGVAIMVLTSLTVSGWGMIAAAVAGAAFVMLLVLITSAKISDNVSLLIVGMMFGSIAGAIVNVLQSISNPDALKVYVVWTMGSLSAVTWEYMRVMAPVLLAGILISVLLIKKLNALLLGDNYAAGLGVGVRSARILIIAVTCVLAGASTAFTGPIAFIGVAVPHIVRGICGTSDHRFVLPASILAGSTLLLVCDIISQMPGYDYSLPINSVCAIIGAPIILAVIIKNKRI